MTVYIGCDPGMDGAIAIIASSQEVYVYDMPQLEAKRIVESTKTYSFRQPDRSVISNILRPWTGAIACVELVHFDSRDSTNKVSAEILIRSQEAVCSSMVCHGIAFQELLPTQWRRVLGVSGCAGDRDKKAIVTEAMRLFPCLAQSHLKTPSSRAKAKYIYWSGRAEALLLAHAAKLLDRKENASSHTNAS